MRRVDGVERDVEEQRAGRVVLGDEPRGLAGDQVRAVALVAAGAIVAVPVEAAVADVGEVVERAVVVAVLVVEPAPGRQVVRLEVAEVPLAADGRLVARLLERLRQRPLLERQAVLRPGADHADLEPVPHRVAPGHQGGAGRRADRLDVELLEPRAGGGEPVEIRRLDLGRHASRRRPSPGRRPGSGRRSAAGRPPPRPRPEIRLRPQVPAKTQFPASRAGIRIVTWIDLQGGGYVRAGVFNPTLKDNRAEATGTGPIRVLSARWRELHGISVGAMIDGNALFLRPGAVASSCGLVKAAGRRVSAVDRRPGRPGP